MGIRIRSQQSFNINPDPFKQSKCYFDRDPDRYLEKSGSENRYLDPRIRNDYYVNIRIHPKSNRIQLLVFLYYNILKS